MKFKISVPVPGPIARLLFPKTFADLEARSSLTGMASKSVEFGKGLLSFQWVRISDKKN